MRLRHRARHDRLVGMKVHPDTERARCRYRKDNDTGMDIDSGIGARHERHRGKARGLRAKGLRVTDKSLDSRVQGLGMRVEGLGVWGLRV